MMKRNMTFALSAVTLFLVGCGGGSDDGLTASPSTAVAVVAAPAASAAASAPTPAASAAVIVKSVAALTISSVAASGYITTAEVGERCVPVARFTAFSDNGQDGRIGQLLIVNTARNRYDSNLWQVVNRAWLLDRNQYPVSGAYVSVDNEKHSMHRDNALRVDMPYAKTLTNGEVYTVCVDISVNAPTDYKMAFMMDKNIGQVIMHAGTVADYSIVGPVLTVQSTVSLPVVTTNFVSHEEGQALSQQKAYQYMVSCDNGCSNADLRVLVYGVSVDQILVDGKRVDMGAVDGVYASWLAENEYSVGGFYVNSSPVTVMVLATTLSLNVSAWIGDSSFQVYTADGRQIRVAPRLVYQQGGKV